MLEHPTADPAEMMQGWPHAGILDTAASQPLGPNGPVQTGGATVIVDEDVGLVLVTKVVKVLVALVVVVTTTALDVAVQLP